MGPGKISKKNNRETVLFSLDINEEGNVDRTANNLELERKLDILQSSHLNLELSVNKFEKKMKEMEEKAKEQENKLQTKNEEINSLKTKIRYKEDKFKKKEEEVTTLKGLLNSKHETGKELKENVQEKEEKIICLEGENHKKSLRVEELETEVKSTLMELNRKKKIVLELEKLTFTQQETIEKVKEEGDAEFMTLQRDLIALITNYAPNLMDKMDFLEEITFL